MSASPPPPPGSGGPSATSPSPAQALDFFTLLTNLKTTKRTGWVRRGVPHPESIADHMYRMAVMALVAGTATNADEPGRPSGGHAGPVDVSKCVLLALAHDVAEAIVGDIAPGDGVSKEDKAAREAAAMESIRTMLGGGAVGETLCALFAEYEAGETREAVLVKDLDKVEMVVQAAEYERAAVVESGGGGRGGGGNGGGGGSTSGGRPLDLSEFFDSVRGRLNTPLAASWAAEAESRRPGA